MERGRPLAVGAQEQDGHDTHSHAARSPHHRRLRGRHRFGARHGADHVADAVARRRRRRHDGGAPGHRLVLLRDHRGHERRGTAADQRGRRRERPPPDVRHAAPPGQPDWLRHHGDLGLHRPDHQLLLRRQGPERRAGRPQAGVQLRWPLRGVRIALRPDARRHQRAGRHLRAEPAHWRGAPGQRRVGRRAGARRRERQPGDQRDRPLHRVPVACDQPRARRHQRPGGHLPARSRRGRRRHLRRDRRGRDRARQHGPDDRPGVPADAGRRRRQHAIPW